MAKHHNTRPPLPMPNIAPLVALATLFTLIGSLFACARLFVRGTMLRSLKWDDHWLLLSMIFGLAGYAVIMVFTVRDFPHMRIDPLGQYYTKANGTRGTLAYSKWYWDFGNLNVAAMTLNVLQNSCSRLSLLFSYRRFTPAKEEFNFRRNVINTFAVLSAVHGVEFAYLEVFPCYPIHVMYYPNDPWQYPKNGKDITCLAPRVPFFLGGIIGAVLDAGVYALPFWLLWKADLKRAERHGLYALFAFGTLVFVFSVVRIPLVYAPLNGPPLFTVPTKQMMNMWIVTVIEAQCILIAASVPTLRPLFRAGRRAGERFHRFRQEGGMRRMMMRSTTGGGSDPSQPPSYVSQDHLVHTRLQHTATVVGVNHAGNLGAPSSEKSDSKATLDSMQEPSNTAAAPQNLHPSHRPGLIGDQSSLARAPSDAARTNFTQGSRDVDILLDEKWELPPPLPSSRRKPRDSLV